MMSSRVSGAPWVARCKATLLDFSGIQVAMEDEGSGLNVVIGALGSSRRPAIWITLEERDAQDSVAISNKFSDAVEEQFGARLFGHGVPLSHGIARLARFHELLGPYLVVVSNAHFGPQVVTALEPLGKLGSNVILTVPSSNATWVGTAGVDRVVDADELALSIGEALQAASGLLPPAVIERLHEEVRGRYAALMNRIRLLAGEPPLLEPQPVGSAVTDGHLVDLPVEVLLTALRRKGALVDAFEVCARMDPKRCHELVDEAGPRYAAAGLHDRLFGALDGLPREVLDGSDSLMRWYFFAATARGEHRALRPKIERFLASNDAPELRALYATAFPDAQLVSQTARALASLETPLTLRMHGFALGQVQQGAEGLEYLLKALRLAEAYGDYDQVVAAATDISNFHIRRGQYREGHEWITWALVQHGTNGCQDELRRLVATSLLAYTRILTDQLVGLESLLAEIEMPDELVGLPTTETAISTLGDWHFVHGRFEDAAHHYQRNLDAVPRAQMPFFAVDVVPALLRMGRSEEAAQLGERARVLAGNADPVPRALGMLASGLAATASDAERAVAELSQAQALLSGNLEAQRLAQASIALAGMHLRRGDLQLAIEALRKGAAGIDQLGFSGWRLCGGVLSDKELWRLRKVYLHEDLDLEIEVLGEASIRFRERVIEPSQRNAECLVVLAANQKGLTGQQLAGLLYGEKAVSGTLKALISRLRDILPIDSRPYRLGVRHRADFLELMEHLKHGRVRQALNLYKGPLLPESEAPAVIELREHIDESLRQAVLASGDAEAMVELANRTDADDLELLEAAFEHVPRNDPQSPLLRARIRQVRRDWGADPDGEEDVKPPSRNRRSSER